MDRWIKCIADQGQIRGIAIQAKDLVQECIEKHKLTDSACEALGEALIGGLFFASMSKGPGRVNFKISGSNTLSQVFVDAYSDGTVRGYLIESSQQPLNPEKGPWGEGVMSVSWTKGKEFSGAPFTGSVPLLTGYIAKDLTFYWFQSEQVPSSVGISVKVKDQKVLSAGGFLVQTLPGASEEEISHIEKEIKEFSDRFTDEFPNHADAMSILTKLFQNRPFTLLEEKPLSFKCKCSKKRVTRAFAFIQKEELKEMVREGKTVSVTCDFCSKVYSVLVDELKEIVEKK